MERIDSTFKTNQLVQKTKRFFGIGVPGLFGLRKWSMDTFPVRVIVTGVEHSGTTILSALIKQEPRLTSGFECGFLLADKPRDFKNVHPWYEWMQESFPDHQWRINSKGMNSICASQSWEEAYRKLLKYSPVVDDAGNQQICDKTPRYLSCLDLVLGKLPECIPCIVIEKDIESLWRSHKKRKSSLDDFCKNFIFYNNGLRRALKRYGERIHRVKYDLLCSNLDTQLRKIFSIIDLPFRTEYVSKYESQLQQYYYENISGAEPLPKTEKIQLDSLEREFSDIYI